MIAFSFGCAPSRPVVGAGERVEVVVAKKAEKTPKAPFVRSRKYPSPCSVSNLSGGGCAFQYDDNDRPTGLVEIGTCRFTAFLLEYGQDGDLVGIKREADGSYVMNFEYDEKGNPISIVSDFDSDNSPDSLLELEYNDKGDFTKGTLTEYYVDRMYWTFDREYRDSGNSVNRETPLPTTDPKNPDFYKKICMVLKDRSGAASILWVKPEIQAKHLIEVREFDEAGRLVSREVREKEDTREESLHRTTYEYNEDGLLVQEEYDIGADGVISERLTHYYDEHGNRIRTDQDGRKAHVIADGVLEENQLYLYDEFGNVLGDERYEYGYHCWQDSTSP